MSEKAAAALLEAAHHADIQITGKLVRSENVPVNLKESIFANNTTSHFINFETEDKQSAYIPLQIDSDIRRAPQFEKMEESEVTVSGTLEKNGNTFFIYPGLIQPSAGPLHCISVSGILASKEQAGSDAGIHFTVRVPNTNAAFEENATISVPCYATADDAHILRDMKKGKPVSLLGETRGFGPIVVKEFN